MTSEKLLELIDETLAWASDISERWTGTLHEKLIDNQRVQLIEAVERGDLNKGYILLCDLGQTLDYAEKMETL